MADIVVDETSFQNVILHLQGRNIGTVTCEIRVSGRPAAYYGPTEYGSARGQRPWPNPGPRTVDSGGRVYSSQAPGGYVRKQRNRLVQFLKQAYLNQVQGTYLPGREDVVSATNQAGADALEAIRSAAPMDSGELKGSIILIPAE